MKELKFYRILFLVLVLILSTSFAFATEKDTAKVSFIRNKIHSECAFHIELEGEDGTKYSSVEEVDANNNDVYSFSVPLEKGNKYYTYKFIPDVDNPENYYGSEGKLWIYGDVTLDGYNLSDGGYYTVSEKKDIIIDVPKGSKVSYCLRPLFYRYMDIVDGEKIDFNEEYDTYKLSVPKTPNAPISYYRVQAPGKVPWWGFLRDFERVDDGHYQLTQNLYENPSQIIREDQRYYEGGILLNGPGSKYLELKTGDYFDIYAFRTWQPIDSETVNAYVEPTYHYNVIEGEDIISVNEDGRIIAKSSGVGIVEVTYDAVDYLQANNGNRILYSACWPERAGIYVVNVDAADSSDISTNILLNEYSTVYYAKSIDGINTGNTSAKYTFKPESQSNQDISVSVGHPSFSDTNPIYQYNWQNYNSNEKGEFTIDLVSGKNIVKVQAGDAVKYQVVAANSTDITTENKYREGKTLEQGDTAIIKFTNIATPIPKLGAIYNPNLDGHEIYYTSNGKELLTRNGQYDLSINTKIEAKLENSGDVEFYNGYIKTAIYGIPNVNHNEMSRGGMMNNGYINGMDNPLIDMGKQSILPNFSIHVEEQGAAEERAKQEAGELKTLQIGWTDEVTTIVKDEEDLVKSQNFNVLNLSNSQNKPVYIKVQAKNPDATITVLYRNSNGIKGSKTIESDKATLLIPADNSFFASNEGNSIDDCYIGYITINVDPGDKVLEPIRNNQLELS